MAKDKKISNESLYEDVVDQLELAMYSGNKEDQKRIESELEELFFQELGERAPAAARGVAAGLKLSTSAAIVEKLAPSPYADPTEIPHL